MILGKMSLLARIAKSIMNMAGGKTIAQLESQMCGFLQTDNSVFGIAKTV